jgi:hypothetical protein
MAAAAAGASPDAVVIEVPLEAASHQEDGVIGETPPEVAVRFESINCWVPAMVGPPSTFSMDGLKKMVVRKGSKTGEEPPKEMRQVWGWLGTAVSGASPTPPLKSGVCASAPPSGWCCSLSVMLLKC